MEMRDKEKLEMGMKYKKYKAADFLSDDYFVNSMFHPTPESEMFWKSLIYEDKIDHGEFVSAYIVLKSLRTDKQEVPPQRLEALWSRIQETNGRALERRKTVRFPMRAAAACAAAVIVGTVVFALWGRAELKQAAPAVTELNYERMSHPGKPGDKIELVAGDVVMAVDGTEADVEYGENGEMKINKESVGKESETAEVQTCQLRVPYGKRAFLKLSDGTSLWVNSGSTVIYPSAFVKNTREIFVEGEIYAEVAHDKEHPFVVATNAMDVRVLGTVFNLSAYREENQTSLVLVSGSVKVKPKNAEAVEVKPNQLLSCTADDCTLQTVDVSGYVSWRDGIYIFSNESIENILLRIARYYNVTMKLPSLSSGITCSGKLVLKDELDQLLHGLSAITPMKYDLTDDNECLVTFDPSK